MSVRSRNEVIVDGMPCIKRAGRIWMNDKVAAEYLGKTLKSFQTWRQAEALPCVRHGRRVLSCKEDLDRATGTLPAPKK